MKKIIVLLLVLLLSGCNIIEKRNTSEPNERYENMIEIINEHEDFLTSSDYFDIAVDVAAINDGYRFYVTIDNARVALYDVEAIAIEKGVDYSTTMAASFGVFESKEYNLVPNQANPDKGFYKGVTMSGLSNNSVSTLYILVQWKSEDMTISQRQVFKLDYAFGV